MFASSAHIALKNEPLQLWERVLVIVGQGFEAGTYVGRIEDFTGGGLVIGAPEFVSGKTRLRDDLPVVVQITRDDALYECDCTVGSKPGLAPGNIWLSAPRDFRRVQRRLYVRLEWHDEVQYAPLSKSTDWQLFPHCCTWHKSDMRDISGSGIRLRAVTPTEVGEVVLVRLSKMKQEGFPEYLFAICRRRLEIDGQINLGLEFVTREQLSSLDSIGDQSHIPTVVRNFTDLEQDKLVVWIFRRQVELRRKGHM